MTFITDDFLLSSDTAARLYHDHAAPQPIFDYHCHLPPQDLAQNRRFSHLTEAWLEGDHYKWRAMRAHGVPETFCTGSADPYDQFLAFAKTVPHTLRNPLYHWTHLELKRYFNLDVLLSEDTAREVWDEANRQLQDLPAAAILDRFSVRLVGTTDAPADDLTHHRHLAEHPDLLPHTTVAPAFRPDATHNLTDLSAWNAVVDQLAAAADLRIDHFDDFLAALAQRHAFFHQHGSRLSDHGLTHLPARDCSHDTARGIFRRARHGDTDHDPATDFSDPPSPLRGHDPERFTAFMMLFFAELDHDAGWTHQLHLGALRNNNAHALKHLGPDTGYDSIGDARQGPGLRRHLGTLAGRKKLPQAVLYNLNPRDNHLFAAMAGNFQQAPTPGSPYSAPSKVQFGSGWWFLDQKHGMTDQLNALSNLGLLSHFVGMLTDSRSLLSYPRHEYFRRLLCDLIAKDVDAGELPRDFDLLGPLVENISFHNAKRYFNLPLKD
ncbi:MAG: glucuronate isomerase [Planctomycetota bacterium]